jgi:hypothetical protein
MAPELDAALRFTSQKNYKPMRSVGAIAATAEPRNHV